MDESQNQTTSTAAGPADAKLSRHSTFDRYPQLLFPSECNNLASDLETPYAFSHHSGSFFWRREDALSSCKWNIWAQPPCLNCIVKGEAAARTCDRYRRQNYTYGLVRTCSRCEKNGNSDACIETIECRAPELECKSLLHQSAISNLRRSRNGEHTIYQYDHSQIRDGRGLADSFQWSEIERDRRRSGLVIWRPINLGVGDVVAKAEAVCLYGQAGGRKFMHGGTQTPDQRRTMEELVARWDQDISVRKVPEPPVDGASGLQADINVELAPLRKADHDEMCQHWTEKLIQAQKDLYELEMKGVGKRAASRTLLRWLQAADVVMSELDSFVIEKARLMAATDIRSEELRKKAALCVLSEETRYWLMKLIPAVLTT
jgi:hypothetical protein